MSKKEAAILALDKYLFSFEDDCSDEQMKTYVSAVFESLNKYKSAKLHLWKGICKGLKYEIEANDVSSLIVQDYPNLIRND